MNPVRSYNILASAWLLSSLLHLTIGVPHFAQTSASGARDSVGAMGDSLNSLHRNFRNYKRDNPPCPGEDFNLLEGVIHSLDKIASGDRNENEEHVESAFRHLKWMYFESTYFGRPQWQPLLIQAIGFLEESGRLKSGIVSRVQEQANEISLMLCRQKYQMIWNSLRAKINSQEASDLSEAERIRSRKFVDILESIKRISLMNLFSSSKSHYYQEKWGKLSKLAIKTSNELEALLKEAKNSALPEWEVLALQGIVYLAEFGPIVVDKGYVEECTSTLKFLKNALHSTYSVWHS